MTAAGWTAVILSGCVAAEAVAIALLFDELRTVRAELRRLAAVCQRALWIGSHALAALYPRLSTAEKRRIPQSVFLAAVQGAALADADTETIDLTDHARIVPPSIPG